MSLSNELQKTKKVNRRRFLAAGTAVLAGAAASRSAQGQAASGSRKRFRIIDTHVHIQNKEGATIEHQLQLMDRGGVDKGFLISYNAEDIAIQFRAGGGDPAKLVSIFNTEYNIRAWKANRDRFWWVPDGVNPLHEGYVEELAENFRMGASGLKMLPFFHGLMPDHEAWDPIYRLCLERRKPIVLDLSYWYFHQYPDPFFNESAERKKLVASFESFADYARLIEPIFEKYPNLPISLAHLGTARIEEDYEHIFALINRYNLSCDLGAIGVYGFPDAAFMRRLVDAIGAERIMYATDTPYWFSGPDSYLTGSRRWSIIADESDFLSDEQKQLILAGNAERFLEFKKP